MSHIHINTNAIAVNAIIIHEIVPNIRELKHCGKKMM